MIRSVSEVIAIIKQLCVAHPPRPATPSLLLTYRDDRVGHRGQIVDIRV